MNSILYYTLQFILGGVSVVSITLIAKYLNPRYTGVAYALPVILIVASIFIYLNQGLEITQKTLRSTFVYEFSLIFFVFLFWFLLSKINFWAAMLVALISWMFIAAVFQLMFKG